jgi:hypothetical protein
MGNTFGYCIPEVFFDVIWGQWIWEELQILLFLMEIIWEKGYTIIGATFRCLPESFIGGKL